MNAFYLKQLIEDQTPCNFAIVLHLTNGDEVKFYPDKERWGVNMENKMFFVYCCVESDDCHIIPVSAILYVTIK